MDSAADAALGDVSGSASASTGSSSSSSPLDDRRGAGCCRSTRGRPGTKSRNQLRHGSLVSPPFGISRWEATAYINIILELDAPGAIELDTLQGLANNVIGLSFGLLGGLDHGGFVQVTLIVDVQLMECILERKDLALIQLRETPVANSSPG